MSACMSDTVCTIPIFFLFTAVNTFVLLGFSDYVSWSFKKKKKKSLNQIIKKIADTIIGKNAALLMYILMIPAREFINIK